MVSTTKELHEDALSRYKKAREMGSSGEIAMRACVGACKAALKLDKAEDPVYRELELTLKDMRVQRYDYLVSLVKERLMEVEEEPLTFEAQRILLRSLSGISEKIISDFIGQYEERERVLLLKSFVQLSKEVTKLWDFALSEDFLPTGSIRNVHEFLEARSNVILQEEGFGSPFLRETQTAEEKPKPPIEERPQTPPTKRQSSSTVIYRPFDSPIYQSNESFAAEVEPKQNDSHVEEQPAIGLPKRSLTLRVLKELEKQGAFAGFQPPSQSSRAHSQPPHPQATQPFPPTQNSQTFLSSQTIQASQASRGGNSGGSGSSINDRGDRSQDSNEIKLWDAGRNFRKNEMRQGLDYWGNDSSPRGGLEAPQRGGFDTAQLARSASDLFAQPQIPQPRPPGCRDPPPSFRDAKPRRRLSVAPELQSMAGLF